MCRLLPMRRKKKFCGFGPDSAITAAHAICKRQRGKLFRNLTAFFPKREKKFFRFLELETTQHLQLRASPSAKNVQSSMAMSRAFFHDSAQFAEIYAKQKDGGRFKKKQIVCSIEIPRVIGIKPSWNSARPFARRARRNV